MHAFPSAVATAEFFVLSFVAWFCALRSLRQRCRRRRFTRAVVARACVASFVCVCVFMNSLTALLRFAVATVVVVAASSSWLLRRLSLLLYTRSFAYKFQHYLKVVLCPFCARGRSRSLACVCVLSLPLFLSLSICIFSCRLASWPLRVLGCCTD